MKQKIICKIIKHQPLFVFIFLFYSAFLGAQRLEYTTPQNLDSLKNRFNHETQPSAKAEVLTFICYKYFNYNGGKAKMDSLSKYFDILSKTYPSYLFKGDSVFLYSKIARKNTNDWNLYMRSLNRCSAFIKTEKDDDKIAFLYYYLALAMIRIEDKYNVSQQKNILQNYLLSLHYFQKSNNQYRILNLLTSIADYHKTNNNFRLTNLYLNEAFKQNEIVKSEFHTIQLLYLKSEIALNTLYGDDLDVLDNKKVILSDNGIKTARVALADLKQVLQKSITYKADFYIKSSINSINYLYLHLHNKDSALCYAFKYHHLNILDAYDSTASYGTIGDVYHEFNDYDLALNYMDTCFLRAKKIGEFDFIKSLYANYADIYAKKNDFKKAYEYQKLHVKLNDSLSTAEIENATNEMQIKFETEKHTNQIKQLNNEVKAKESKNKQQRFITYGVILFSALIFLLLFFAFNYYAKRKQIQTEKLIQKAEDQERARLAQDLHDDLGGTLSALKLNVTSKNSNDESTIDILNKAIIDLRSISHKLMPLDFENSGIDKNLQHYISTLNSNNLQFKYLFYGSDAVIKKDKQIIIYRIVLELLNNIIKHSGAKHVSVQGIVFKNKITFTVEDDGKGFNPSKEQEGMGLKNIRQRVDLLKGKISFDSTKNGTTVMFEIPI